MSGLGFVFFLFVFLLFTSAASLAICSQLEWWDYSIFCKHKGLCTCSKTLQSSGS